MQIPTQEILCRDGLYRTFRSPTGADAAAMLDYLRRCAETTDFMLRYPDEITFTLAEETALLDQNLTSPNSFFLSCFQGDALVGNVAVYPIGGVEKVRHRCGVGLGLTAPVRGLGIGTLLMEQALYYAQVLGYEQMELDVGRDNAAGLALYEKFHFQTIGHLPHGMKCRDGSYQDLVLMVKVLQEKEIDLCGSYLPLDRPCLRG